MLGMMGNDRRERGAMMGNKAVMDVISRALLGDPTEPGPIGEASQSQLKTEGAAVMRALQAGDVDAFTAALQRFFIVMEEMDDVAEDPFDLEVG